MSLFRPRVNLLFADRLERRLKKIYTVNCWWLREIKYRLSQGLNEGVRVDMDVPAAVFSPIFRAVSSHNTFSAQT